MTLTILGLATALPEHTMSVDEAVAMSTDLICRNDRETRLLATIYRRSRVRSRHTCVPYRIAYQWSGDDFSPGTSPGPTTLERMQLYSAHAGPLAARASAEALAAAGVEAKQIKYLITVSCTGFEAPGVDIHLLEQLGLPATTQRLHIGYMGCHGAINGLRAARALSAADPSAHILMCAVELCSLHYTFHWDPERILGNALFADGAAAIVAGPASTQEPLCHVQDTGSCLLANSKEMITWRIGNHGFEMSLSNQLPGLIRDHIASWLSQWLESQGSNIRSVASWAVHPGGPRILDAAEEALELDAEALATSRGVLSDYGNMSSPTVLFILQRLLQQEARRPYVMLGFGPGVVAEVAFVT